MTILTKLRTWMISRAMKKEDSPLYKNEKLINSERPMAWCIYEPEKPETYGAHWKRFHFLTHSFKNMILVPLMTILDKFIGPYMTKRVPDKHYNTAAKVFDIGYENAISDWANHYLGKNFDKEGKEIPKEDTREDAISGKCSRPVRVLRTMKNLVLTMCFNDTAYREFLNMLVYNLGKEFAKQYKGKDIKHLLYMARHSQDVHYYALTKVLEDGRVQVTLVNPKEEQNDKINKTKTSKPVK